MKTLLVKFRIAQQVSPDDYEMTSKERMFPEDTKLSEVKEWVLNCGGYSTKTGYKRMCEVFLSEPE